MVRDDYPVELSTLAMIGEHWNVLITAKWLSKRMDQGLLPRHAHSPGLGRAAGRDTAQYSKEVEAQLTALLNALKAHGKNLAAVGWDVWWHGWYADRQYWHAPLIRVAHQWAQLKSQFPTSDSIESSDTDLIQNISEELASRKNAGSLIGAVKRHARDQLPDFLEIIISILNGSHLPLMENPKGKYESGLLNLLGKSLSLPVSDALIPAGDSHFPVSAEALDGQLNNIAKLADIEVDAFIASLSDHEIENARDEISLFVHAIAEIEKMNGQKTGRSSGTKAISWSVADAKGQAAFLMGWLLLRRNPEMRVKIAGLNKQIIEQIKSTGRATNVLETRPHIFKR